MANLQKKSLWQQYGNLILILSGILIGALIGVVAPNFGTTIKPIGDIFLNLLFTIVVPLVFVSIASAVGSMANMKRLGKILGGTIGTFIFTGAIAGVCVLVWVNLFSPSAGTTIELVASEVGEAQTAGELLVSSLTVSDFSDLWDKSNMLPLIIFAILFGFCVSACGGEQSPMGRLLANLNDIIMKFVGIIMLGAPIGLGAYFANLVATYGPEIIGDYGRSMLVYYPLCALYGVIFFPLYAFLAGGRRGVAAMVKNILRPAVTAFATQSSAATIPVNKEACDSIGVPKDVFLLGCPYCRHAEVRPAGHTSIRCLLNYANPVNPFQVVFDLLLCRSLAIQVGNTVDQVHHLLPFCLRNGLERLLRKLFPTDYLLQPHKNRRGLRPVGGALGLEGAVLIPGQDARLAHELHPRLGPVRHGIPIREGSRRVPGLGQGEAGAVYIAGDHGSHLLPGHRAIGGKTAVSCAIHNSFPSGPGHIGTIPPACRHIGKPTLATLLLRTGHPAQDGDKHSPGQTAAGLEHCGAHPIHQVIFIDIAHRLVGPVALGNIDKGVLSRRQGRARQQGQHHAQRQGCGNHSSLHKPLSSLERSNDV